jgi:hypothetical protein
MPLPGDDHAALPVGALSEGPDLQRVLSDQTFEIAIAIRFTATPVVSVGGRMLSGQIGYGVRRRGTIRGAQRE